jgi:hypothetical protein
MIALGQWALDQGRCGLEDGSSPAAQSGKTRLLRPIETLISCSATVYLFRDLSTTRKVAGFARARFDFPGCSLLLRRRSISRRLANIPVPLSRRVYNANVYP